jgi:PAS domain S-box-containing protein
MPPPIAEPRLIAECLAALNGEPTLAVLLASGAPTFLAQAQPMQILWANPAALALFESADVAALTLRLFGQQDPGAKRLSELARTGLPGRPARMERLRFFIGRRAEAVTLLCRSLRLKSGATILAAAAIGARTLKTPTLSVEQSITPSSVSDRPEIALPRSSSTDPTTENVRETWTQLKRTSCSRFLWRSDAANRFSYLSPELRDIVGAYADNLVGRGLAEVAREFALDADGAFARAIAGADTFNGIELLWPIEGLDAVVPVSVGGLPAYDPSGAFAGFRGFGIIHADRLRPQFDPTIDGQSDPQRGPAGAPATAGEKGEPSLPTAASDGVAGLRVQPNVVYLRPQFGVGEHAGSSERAEADEEVASGAAARGLISGQAFVGGRPILVPADNVRLSSAERNAFREIARALSAHVEASVTRQTTAHDMDGRHEDQTGGNWSRLHPAREERLEPETYGLGPSDQPSPIEAAVTPGSGSHLNFSPGEDAEPAVMETFGDLAEGVIESILDSLPIGIAVMRGPKAVFVNRPLLNILGHGDRESVGDSLERLLEDLGSLQPEEEKTLNMTAGGGEISIECRAQATKWAGAAALLVSVRRSSQLEFAQRLRVLEFELRLKDAETRELHAILDTATDGVVVLDEKGRVLSLNRSAEALFGYEQHEVTGESITILLGLESHRVALDYLENLKANGLASVFNDGRDVMGRERQGGAIPMFMTIGRVGSGTSPKFCAVLRDMTQWKKAERELSDAKKQAERASALKSDFLAKISHEIRTPLNAILGFAEVIMEERFGPVGNDRYKDYLKDIHASGSHVMSLVNDLLDLSKIEAGKLELNFASVDANRVVRECVSLMQPQASSARVVVRQALGARLPNIVADERSLRQIVLNLLSNAMKFNEPGGQVIVSTALTDAGHAMIRIRDTGIGMSDSEIEMALEPFRQITTTHRSLGTGLGLPLTKALVEANRASFTIKSRRKEGTLVEVAFPPTRVLAE